MQWFCLCFFVSQVKTRDYQLRLHAMPFPTTSVHSVSPSSKLTSQFDVGLGDFAASEAEPSKASDAGDLTSDDPQSKVDPGHDEQQLNVSDGDGNGCADDDEQQQEEPDIRQMTARQLRNLCKSHNLTVRGRKDEILSRLKDVLKIDCEDGSGKDDSPDDGDFQADGESNDESLSGEASEDGSLQVRSRPCREVRAPERYSPQSSVHDDADSDWDGISLDEDASVYSLSSDSSEARSIVEANKKRRVILFRSVE